MKEEGMKEEGMMEEGMKEEEMTDYMKEGRKEGPYEGRNEGLYEGTILAVMVELYDGGKEERQVFFIFSLTPRPSLKKCNIEK